MADPEVGNAILISNILVEHAAKQCTYQYPFNTVREFIDFCQKLTRFGESGVYGFLEHLNSRDAATLLLQSITTEARQQMIFRQFEGLFPMPVWFEVGITQSMAWTLLAPYLVTCPADNPHIIWQNFPALSIEVSRSVRVLIKSPPNTFYLCLFFRIIPMRRGTTTQIRQAMRPRQLSHTIAPCLCPTQVEKSISLGKSPARQSAITTAILQILPLAHLKWAELVLCRFPHIVLTSFRKFVAWVSQLNTTYTDLLDINGTSGKTYQPGGRVFGDGTSPIVNGTMYVISYSLRPDPIHCRN